MPQDLANSWPDDERREYDSRFDSPTVGPEPASNGRDLVGETIALADHGESTARNRDNLQQGPSEISRQFGDYELLREIARGGMGVVYKARQKKLNRIVALKMILAGQLASDEDVRRFYAEAEAAAHLDHSGVVPIYEVGQHNGQHFFSMGYVDGRSLAAEVANGPLAPRRAAELARKTAEAVAFAHAKGVVHRDLKPANILLDKSDEPKVTDFGLAKRVETETGITQSGAILGTPSYMPPEQAAGKTEEIGPLSDVYSLGAVLYCLLTGRPPFQAARPMETLLLVLAEEPVPPRDLNPGVPRDLETIALKCLSKEPSRRYASAEELAQDLGRYLGDEPILARPVGTVECALRWCRRNPWIAGLTAAVALSLIVGIATSTTLAILASRSATLAQANESLAKTNETLAKGESLRANQEQQAAKRAAGEAKVAADAALAAEKIADREKKVAEAERDRAEANLYPAAIQLADRARRENNLANMQQRLESQQPSGGKDHRGWEWYYLRGLAFGEQLSFRGHAKYIESVAWHPEGKLVASSSGDGVVKIWNAGDGSEFASWQFAQGKWCELAWNKSGDRLLCVPAPMSTYSGGDNRVVVWSLASRAVEFSQPGVKAAWRPDGLALAIPAADSVLMWDTASGKTQTQAVSCAAESPIAFGPDGSRFAVVDTKKRMVHVCDAKDGHSQTTLTGHVMPVFTIAFHPSQNQIATGGAGTEQARVWDVATAKPIRLFPLHDGKGPISQLGWNQTGQWLAIAYDRPGNGGMRRGMGSMVKIFGVDGNILADHEASKFAWSAAGDRIALLHDDRLIGISQLDGKSPEQLLRGHTATIYSFDWSPDGKQLVSGGTDVTAKIWNSPPSPALPAVAYNSPIAWQPGGNLVALAGTSGNIELLDAATWKRTKELNFKVAYGTCLAWNRDGSELAVGGINSETKRGELLVCDPMASEPPRSITFSGATSLGFSGDGREVLTHGIAVYDSNLRVFDAATLRETSTRDLGRAAHVFAYSPATNRFAHSLRDNGVGSVVIRDMTSGNEVMRIDGLHYQILAIAFDDPRNRLAIAAFHEDSQFGEITVWDLKRNKKLHSFTAHEVSRIALAFHPTDDRLVSAGGKTAILWDLVTGQELLSLDSPTGHIDSLTWSPDGRRLVACCIRELYIWDSSVGHTFEEPLPAAYFRRDVRAGGFF